MKTRIRYFPVVPANVWGNQTNKPIPQHWDVEWHDGIMGWWTRSEHKNKTTALAAEAVMERSGNEIYHV